MKLKLIYILTFISTLLLGGHAYSQSEKKGKPVAKNWQSQFYYSYFSKYYYGYYHGYGASELGITFGNKGWEIDARTWIRDQYGVGLGYSDRYKGEKGLSFLFAYGMIPSLQVTVGPMIRFIPATPEVDRTTKVGFELNAIYYYWKNFGFKAGYNSTAGFNGGVSIRVNNLIWEP